MKLERLHNFVNLLTRVFPYPLLEKNSSKSHWKNDLLFAAIVSMVVFGTIAYFPSLVLSLLEPRYDITAISTVVYFSAVYVAMSKRLTPRFKLIFVQTLYLILGFVLLLVVGPVGAGIVYLFVVPSLTGLFYSIKQVIRVGILMILAFALLSIPVFFRIDGINLGIQLYNRFNWVATVINFLAISFFFSAFISVLLTYLNKSLNKHTELTHELIEKKSKLEKEKQKAERNEKLKSAFLANMSHEIRTPMNAIIGFSSLMNTAKVDPETSREYHSMIQESSEDLIRLMNDIIDISRIESNQLVITERAVDLPKKLNHIIQSQKQSKTFKANPNLKLHLVHPASPFLQAVLVDDTRLRQILNNLITNAIKYTEKGNIKLKYRVVEMDNSKYIEFTVEDQGRGIPMEEQERIFKPFFQGSTARLTEGAGLGLSIVKGLTDLMRGEIILESEYDEGTTISVLLPYRPTSKAKKIISPSHREEMELYPGKLVYVAEDDHFSAIYLKKLMELAGVQYEIVSNGKEIVDLVEKNKPDLILMDMNMPVMDGYEATRLIRKSNKEIPVVAQTAYAMAEDIDKCIASGCTEIISKPITSSILNEIFKEYISIDPQSSGFYNE
ncbi:MAG TPA: hypothetical protein DDX92_12815 [Flavobacteriales bacterium]|nr:hypothetical protein [Flavobacteriales bacterium]